MMWYYGFYETWSGALKINNKEAIKSIRIIGITALPAAYLGEGGDYKGARKERSLLLIL